MNPVTMHTFRAYLSGHWRIAVVALLTATVLGCAASSVNRQAEQQMRMQNFAQAEELLLSHVVLKPDDANAWAKLGEARYHLGKHNDALEALNRALVIDPKQATAFLFKGIIAEDNDDLDGALHNYRNFLGVEGRGRRAENVAQRLERLQREAAEKFARGQLAREAQLKVSEIPDSSVGVVYFDNRHLPENLQPLNRGLAEMLITDLSQSKSLLVVERLKLEKVQQELELSHSAMFDTTTAPRWGKLLGASRLVSGEVSELTDERIRLDPHIITTATGDVTSPYSETGALEDFFRMEKRLVFALFERLGVELSAEERDAISKVPTESMVAFLAYSRGLEFYDLGLYKEASAEFEQAVQADPGFEQAQSKLDLTVPLRGGLGPPRSMREFTEVVTGTSMSGGGESDATLQDRLGVMSESTGMIPPAVGTAQPAGSGEGAEPYTGAVGVDKGTVNIHGTFDDRGGE